MMSVENSGSAATSERDDAQHLPAATTPTWESELLISAAVVFALFQLPGVLDDTFVRWQPGFAGGTEIVAFFLLIYAKIVLFALIATFVTHLCARGYWTALVGLRSVFPNGVRWENAGDRPIFLALMREQIKPQGVIIERVDNFASAVFGVGAMLVVLALFSLLVTLVALSASFAVSWAFFDGRGGPKVFFGAMATIAVVISGAGLLDRLFGRRLAPDGWIARTVRAALRVSLLFPMMRASNALLLLFTSNVGRKRGMVFAIGTLYLLIAIVMFQTVAQRGATKLDDYRYFPVSEENVIVPRHYAATRVEKDRFSRAPYVQAQTIADPYLRLFVPYSPTRLNSAMRAKCPAPSDDSSATRDRLVLECATRLFAVAIDAKRIDVVFDFAIEPDSGLRGFLALIPLDELARGRHELTLENFPRVGDFSSDESGTTPPRERIAFWR